MTIHRNIYILFGVLVFWLLMGAYADARQAVEHPAVVRVSVQDRGGITSHGTGVLVTHWDRRYMLTCAHTSADAINRRTATITLQDGTRQAVDLLAINESYDFTVYGSESLFDLPPESFIEMADGARCEGDDLYALGYGSGRGLSLEPGRGIRYTAPPGETFEDWLEMSGNAISGDSGGPILNREGKLVAILWGSDGRTILGTQINRIKLILGSPQPTAGRIFNRQQPARQPGST